MSRLIAIFLNLSFLIVPAWALPEDGGKKPLILFLGDSLTAGYGLDPAQAYPARIARKIESSGYRFEVFNAGLSGETSAGGLRRIDWLLRRKPRIMILELGANDGLRGVPLNLTRSNLQGIIDRAKERFPELEIVMAGMMMPPNLGRRYSNEFRLLFQELAQANDLALIPFLLKGVAGDPKLNLADGIHPNGEGHRIVADNVWKVLEPILKRLR